MICKCWTCRWSTCRSCMFTDILQLYRKITWVKVSHVNSTWAEQLVSPPCSPPAGLQPGGPGGHREAVQTAEATGQWGVWLGWRHTSQWPRVSSDDVNVFYAESAFPQPCSSVWNYQQFSSSRTPSPLIIILLKIFSQMYNMQIYVFAMNGSIFTRKFTVLWQTYSSRNERNQVDLIFVSLCSTSFMSDFDIMLAQRKAMNSKRRRHRDGGTFINDADDVVSAMINKMNEAAEVCPFKVSVTSCRSVPTTVLYMSQPVYNVCVCLTDWVLSLSNTEQTNKVFCFFYGHVIFKQFSLNTGIGKSSIPLLLSRRLTSCVRSTGGSDAEQQ